MGATDAYGLWSGTASDPQMQLDKLPCRRMWVAVADPNLVDLESTPLLAYKTASSIANRPAWNPQPMKRGEWKPHCRESVKDCREATTKGAVASHLFRDRQARISAFRWR